MSRGTSVDGINFRAFDSFIEEESEQLPKHR
jgi:hypothetical protein